MNALHTSQNNLRIIAMFFFSLFGMLSTTASETNTEISSEATLQNTKIVITKDTTDEALRELALEMKEKGIAFSYSKVQRNNSGEITGISISYNNNSNKGTYSVSSDDPINTIVIISEGNTISVRAAGNGNQATIQQGGTRSNIILEDHKKEMEQRSEAMEVRRQEMKDKMNRRKAEMDAKRNEMMARRSDLKDPSDSDQTFLKEINKDSSDADLEALKNEFKENGMLFSYKDIQRNSDGEILNISIELDDQNGSVSKSNYTSDTPIKMIRLGMHNGASVLKSEQ